LHKITNLVYYQKGPEVKPEVKSFEYFSPKSKSSSLDIKLSFVNPTDHVMRVKLYRKSNPEELFPLSEQSEPFAFPFCAMINDRSGEVEPNVSGDDENDIGFVVELFNESDLGVDYSATDSAADVPVDPVDQVRKIRTSLVNGTAAFVCEASGIVDQNLFKSGSIWTVMPLLNPNGSEYCRTSVTMDSKPNTISILWILPQYFIITVAEVLVSVTGIEFAYSQAPRSMKYVSLMSSKVSYLFFSDL